MWFGEIGLKRDVAIRKGSERKRNYIFVYQKRKTVHIEKGGVCGSYMSFSGYKVFLNVMNPHENVWMCVCGHDFLIINIAYITTW